MVIKDKLEKLRGIATSYIMVYARKHMRALVATEQAHTIELGTAIRRVLLNHNRRLPLLVCRFRIGQAKEMQTQYRILLLNDMPIDIGFVKKDKLARFACGNYNLVQRFQSLSVSIFLIQNSQLFRKAYPLASSSSANSLPPVRTIFPSAKTCTKSGTI